MDEERTWMKEAGDVVENEFGCSGSKIAAGEQITPLARRAGGGRYLLVTSSCSTRGWDSEECSV